MIGNVKYCRKSHEGESQEESPGFRDLLVTPKVQHHSGIRDCETQEQVFRVLSDKDAVKELKALYEF